jgi:hypothetical protein
MVGPQGVFVVCFRKQRSINLSAECQAEYDTWIECIQKYTQGKTVASCAEDLASQDPEWQFDKDTGSIRSIVITAAIESGDSIYPEEGEDEPLSVEAACSAAEAAAFDPRLTAAAVAKKHGDVNFLVTVVHREVRWCVQQPFSRFVELEESIGNANPALRAQLCGLLPAHWPLKPRMQSEHLACATSLQLYFEEAVSSLKRIHQPIVTKLISPLCGRLRILEGRLGVRRHLHKIPDEQTRWCKLDCTQATEASVFSWAYTATGDECHTSATTMSAAFADFKFDPSGQHAPGVVARGQPDQPLQVMPMSHVFVRRGGCTIGAASPRSHGPGESRGGVGLELQLLDTSNAGTWVHLAMPSAETYSIWSGCMLALAADELSVTASDHTLPEQFWIGGQWLWSWMEHGNKKIYSPQICEQLEEARAKGNTSFRLDTTLYFSGEIDLMNMVRRSDTPNEGEDRASPACAAPHGVLTGTTGPVAASRVQVCRVLRERGYHADEPAAKYDASLATHTSLTRPIPSLSIYCPDHTRLSHPRRGSLSGLAGLEIDLEKPNVWRRRRSTDAQYLGQMQPGVGCDDSGGRRSLRDLRQTISGGTPPSILTANVDDKLVLDFGSYSMQIGRARDLEFPASVELSRDPASREWLVQETELGQLRCVEWDSVERLWETILMDEMKINPRQHDFVVTEPPDSLSGGKSQMAERLLESLGVGLLCMQSQAECGSLLGRAAADLSLRRWFRAGQLRDRVGWP